MNRRVLRVAQLVAAFPPHHGGMGYVCLHNALDLSRRGHDVEVFTIDYGISRDWEDPAGLIVKRVKPVVRHGNAGFLPQVYRWLKGFDVAHVHFPFYGADEFVYMASVVRGLPYVLTYHMDVRGESRLKRLLVRGYDRFLLRSVLRRASVVGALSREHLESTKAAGLVNWGRVVELPNGVDSHRFTPRSRNASLMKRYGLEGKTVVLFVGNLLYLKGLHLLMDAVIGLQREDVVLLVVGGGYEEEYYHRLVRERGLEKTVVFAGSRAPEEDLPLHYNLGDMLVLPSLYSEAFPLVVIEAMASGIPAIVSALPGPTALVEDGVNGLVARVGDVKDLRRKISLLVQDSERRRSMGARARQKVEDRYTWERVGDRLESALFRAVGIQ